MKEEENYDDWFQREEKRFSRTQRKSKRQKDQSQYRKSDMDQRAKREALSSNDCSQLQRGRIVSIHGEHIQVDSQGTLFSCYLRGALKLDLGRSTHAIAVGDLVLFERVEEGGGHILHVEERTSFLSRAETLSQRREQLLVANVDQLLITSSLLLPPLKPALIDRYVIAAQRGKIQPLLIINKADLLDHPESGDERALLKEVEEAYAIASIPLLLVSAQTGQGLDELRSRMNQKASVFSGPSGVGKSSLINALLGTELATAPPIAHSRKGSHTTTRAQLLPLPTGGWIIDTPGIKSFGLWQLKEEEELSSYFREIAQAACRCRFRNCSHHHEEGCAVLEALDKGQIHPLRYGSYSALLDEVRSIHRRR